jgi:hypothetical protein
MIKYLDIHPEDPHVDFKVINNGILEKTAEYDQELKDFVSTIEAKPGSYYLLVNALGAGEYYGCFFENQQVITSTGYKNIQYIELGEEVLTHKGNFKKVIKTFKKEFTGNKTLISVQNLPDFQESTSNHPFMVLRKEKLEEIRKKYYKQKITKEDFLQELSELKYEWVAAEDILPGDYVYKPIEPNVSTSNKFTEDEAYLFGYYLSEGYLVKKYKNISSKGEYKGIVFVMSETDIDMIDKLEQITHSLYITGTKTSNKTFRIEYNNKEHALLLDKLFGHRPTNKFIHPDIFKQPEKWKLQFLAAYADGDGCVNSSNSKYDGSVALSTASRNLALDLQRLLASVGIVSSISRSSNLLKNSCYGKQDSDIYEVSIGSSYSEKLLRHSLRLKNNYVTKKRPAENGGFYILPNNYMLMKVKEVTTKEVEEETIKYNLEVEEDNSYVVDFIGHNSNRNSDYFPEKALKEYHKTFETLANVYRHHRNKPKRGHPVYGKVLFSHYNEKMHRVELVLELDVNKAPDLKEIIDRGEYPPLSMGAKVPYDTCSICKHKAKTIMEYCDHAKHQMGKILNDGRKVYVINDHPKFFDISFVRIPADRTAYVMAKVASTEITLSAQNAEDIMKEAGIKEADIVKKIDGAKIESVSDDPKRLIVDSQPDMPENMLKSLAKEHNLNNILSTLIGLRIMPKRRDFQKLVLHNMGEDSLADEYDRKGMVFVVRRNEEPVVPFDVDPRFFSSDIAKQICSDDNYIRRAPLTKPIVMFRVLEKMAALDNLSQEGSLMEQAGIVPPPFPEPFDPLNDAGPIVEQTKPNGEVNISSVKNPLFALGGIAGLYYGLTKVFNNARGLDKVIIQNPWMLPVLIGGASLGAMKLQENMKKTAGLAPYGITRALVIVPGTYLWSGSAENKVRRGEEIGSYSNLVRKHPLLASIGHTLASGKALNLIKRGSIAENPFTEIMFKLGADKYDQLYDIIVK